MGNKINKSATTLREQIEVRNLLIGADFSNSIANRMVWVMSKNISEHATALAKKCTVVQDGAIARGLTFSPLADFRLSGRNVARFLAAYQAARAKLYYIRTFEFTHCDGYQIILDEDEVDWLADRLQIDNLNMIMKELSENG